MGVTRRWLTWVLAGGFILFFVGERAFHDVLVARMPLSFAGAAAVLGAVLLRVRTWLAAEGQSRQIERLFGLAYLGCAVSLLGFFVGTEEGVRFLGVQFEDPMWEVRFRRGTLAGATMFLAISGLPALVAQWAVREGEGSPEAALPVRALRISETASGALTVSLAGCFLMLTGYLTSAHNRTLDASYFKTSRPGTSVQEIVRNLEAPLEARLFFPDLNPVGDEVAGYFRELESRTGNVIVERHDRLAEPWEAEEHDVRTDGVVLLSSGTRSERVLLSTDLDQARARLRVFDGDLSPLLLSLARARRTAYLTVGHGEINDPESADLSGATGADAGNAPPTAPPTEALRQLLGLLNYDVQELGLQRGLGDRIPDDAAVVLVLGPTTPFAPQESEALSNYLDRGGSLLLALEPTGQSGLDALISRLGLDYNGVTLADERRHVREQGGVSDRRLIITDRFSSHPSVTTASRQGVGAGILLVGAGYLTETASESEFRPRFTIGSMNSTFADVDGDFSFDEGPEAKATYDLAAAIEGPESEGSAMRALVYADAEMFTDPVLVSFGLNRAVVADGVRWLGEEEEFAGETASEEDVPIVHTRSEDVAWFYAIILGAPAMILVIGFLNGSLRKGRKRRPTEVEA